MSQKPSVPLFTAYKVSRREIERIVDRLDVVPADEFTVTDAEEVRVAAIQLLLKRYASLADYVIDMNLYVSDAVNRRAQLICFPAFAGMLPASFLPQFDTSIARIRPLAETGLPDPAQLGDCLSYFADSIHDAFLYTMSTLAARYRVHIMAGSALCFEEDDLRHRAFLFSDGGDLVGVQDKLSLSRLELSLGLEPGSEVKVFDTPAGAAAILTGTDADYFEVARVARSLGARILLHPTALEGEYTPLRSTLGLNMRVQENRVYGIQSVLVGDTGLGFAAEGACCSFAPAEMTRQRNGIVGRSSGRFEPDILCQTLNMERILKSRNPYRGDRNPEFMEKYLDRLY